MQIRLLVCALTFAPAFIAQTEHQETKPQMVWRGDVDGTTFLYIHAKRLKAENKDSAAIENQRYRFTSSLPAIHQNVRLHVSEGRGYVHIVEQPRVDNDFTLAISIEDRQPGSSPYAIALYWEPEGIFDRATEGGRSQVKWSGRVEDEVMVSCAAGRCTSEAVRGTPVMREHFKFARPLPPLDVVVRLEGVDGRGEVRLVEQPSERNGYTARVQIRDPQGGAGDYTFAMTWKTPALGGSELARSEKGLLWSGRVAGTVRITVHGGAAFSESVNGQPVAGERAQFERPLPAKSDTTAAVKKLQGRGTVAIVEYPTSRNGYQLVFEVRDSEGGSDVYEVEVSW